uniref:Uncharacterized protein n=1 Tax=Anguilla anguilla TaxID=7936 RepID=A0A0E9RCF6_ANGAN
MKSYSSLNFYCTAFFIIIEKTANVLYLFILKALKRRRARE